ncbi:MAG: minor capsid protein [Culicoidibacterales bacterium]
MKFSAKYENKISKITSNYDANKKRFLREVSADFERKANQFAPRDEGDLMNSSSTSIKNNGFDLYYNVPYAIKVYRAVKVKTGVNPNARPYWTDEAWKRNKEVYLKKWKQLFSTKN